MERVAYGQEKDALIGKLRGFEIKKLSVLENWAEVRFCAVDMPRIQLLEGVTILRPGFNGHELGFNSSDFKKVIYWVGKNE